MNPSQQVIFDTFRRKAQAVRRRVHIRLPPPCRTIALPTVNVTPIPTTILSPRLASRLRKRRIANASVGVFAKSGPIKYKKLVVSRCDIATVPSEAMGVQSESQMKEGLYAIAVNADRAKEKDIAQKIVQDCFLITEQVTFEDRMGSNM
mmetsp:Transcript_14685/g.37495  ORF Transcript_14685/g.37495 Transcript_14685/m.37495 type:complete len:149 (-) Transcript_14685:120-566(-)|eukprot:CAMPEP_0174903364 /NCGR_PEP_ID=MMETSP0167-20121228/43429_1 /TAXON_ID=38298 /ORGANISM="Rhodella maculata, Strain CCMP736" /LENGTH=148 /DNA_ID=CAMNT_0016145675 /DNA_START=106 /DNA_END=552 /DNA_ORIENTATION=+